MFDDTEINAARIATSVFPNPTSPHKTRFIGFIRERSFFIDRMDSIWSGVSLYGNSFSKFKNKSSSAFKRGELALFLLDSISNISAAWSITLLSAFDFLIDHLFDESESILILVLLFLW